MNENKNNPNKKYDLSKKKSDNYINNLSKSIENLNKNESTTNHTIKYKNSNDAGSKKIIIKIIVILLIGLSFLLTLKIYSFFKKFQYEKIDQNDIGINEEMFKGELDKIVNIALLGIDANGTSDAILIASLNPNEENPTIKLISIARDTLAEIFPKNKKNYYTKITESYGNGGEETVLRSLNKNFNLNVKNFISIKNQGFATIVDKIGGVDLTITKDEKDQINGIMKTTKQLEDTPIEYLQEYGNVHLNGMQTAAFVRIRKKPTKSGKQDDFGRGDRQKEVLKNIFTKIKTVPKRKIISLVEPCLKYLKTSFKISGIFKLCKDILARKYSVKEISIPSLNTPIDMDYTILQDNTPKSTVLYDLEYAGKIINAFIYDDVAPNDFILKNPPPGLNTTKQKLNQNNKISPYHITSSINNNTNTIEKKNSVAKEFPAKSHTEHKEDSKLKKIPNDAQQANKSHNSSSFNIQIKNKNNPNKTHNKDLNTINKNKPQNNIPSQNIPSQNTSSQNEKNKHNQTKTKQHNLKTKNSKHI